MLPNSIPEAFKEKIEFIINQTADRVAEQECLLPTAFISSGKQLAVVGTPFRTSQEKDLAAAAVSEMCDKFKAELLIYALESWVVKFQNDAGEENPDFEALKSGEKQVSKHPLKQEVVIFQVETKTKAWLAQGLITRDAEGKRTMQPVEWFEGGLTEGRFTRILNKLKVVH